MYGSVEPFNSLNWTPGERSRATQLSRKTQPRGRYVDPTGVINALDLFEAWAANRISVDELASATGYDLDGLDGYDSDGD